MVGTAFEFGEVFCFTRFLSRVRGRVRVEVGGNFSVRVKVRAR